mgnify:CR=1 FL=1
MNFLKHICRFIKYHLLRIKYCLLCKFKKRDIKELFSDSESFVLFITHNYGGGTKTFENNYISNSDKKIVICRMISYKKNLSIKIEKDGKSFYFSSARFEMILSFLFAEIILNSLISFYKLEEIINLLVKYKNKNSDVKFTYMVHDYHCICPNFNLISDNWNCNLKCGEHKCSFNEFSHKFIGNVEQWRNIWKKLFLVTDEIRCFSTSSMKILKNAFPDLSDKKFNVVPHSMEYCKFTPIKNIENFSFHIGIVGAVHLILKGRFVIQELFKRLPEEIPISIIGSSKYQFGKIKRKNIRFLGKYKHENLQKLVESENISMEIFPSIWTETFSYLVSEHIAMNVPIICFDMGAQSEKVRTYTKGIIVKDIDEMVNVIIKKFNEREKKCFIKKL